MPEFLVITGDVLDVLRERPDASVHCCVTSPPYWGLRDYGVEGQIGLEDTPEAWVARMVDVFRAVRRVLRDDGTVWLNVGDSYASAPGGGQGPTGALAGREINGARRGADTRGASKPKDLVGQPWLLAFALRADGWYLRSEIIWCLSGGTRVYARTQKGEAPMAIKDLVRLDPATVKLWNGKDWVQALGWNESPRPDEPLEIELRSGERIGATPGHEWPTQRGIVRTDALRIGDELQTCRLPEPAHPRVPRLLPDEEIGYLVGLYVAEGSRSGSTVQIASHASDSTRLRAMEKIARALDGTCAMHETGGHAATINLHGPTIVGVLDAYVSGHDAYNKHLSPRCWRRTDAFLDGVLRGYLDGDGHFDGYNNRWRLGFTRNDNLAADLRTICARLGFTIRLRRTFHKFDGRRFPGYRGEIRMQRTGHHNEKPDGEVVALGRSRARQFWDIGVEGEPHLFALASGVLTHNSKPNPMPESVTDRPTKAHETIFLLSKSPRYFYDADAVREEHADYRPNKSGRSAMQGQAALRPRGNLESPDRYYHPAGRNLRDVWTVATHPYPGAHFATFPPKLIEPCIKAGTSEHGVCPECGAPWVRVVELSPEYRSRLTQRKRPDMASLGGWLRAHRLGTGMTTQALAEHFRTAPDRVNHGGCVSNWENGKNVPTADQWETLRRLLGFGAEKDAIVEAWHDYERGQWGEASDSMATGAPGPTSRMAKDARTTGWRPTCDHDADPIPATVLDPFTGAGTTGLVATGLGRDFLGVEINPEYAEMARRRISAGNPLYNKERR